MLIHLPEFNTIFMVLYLYLPGGRYIIFVKFIEPSTGGMKLISEPAEISGNALLLYVMRMMMVMKVKINTTQLPEDEDGVGHREGGCRGFLSALC